MNRIVDFLANLTLKNIIQPPKCEIVNENYENEL